MASSSNRAIESVNESQDHYNALPHLQEGDDEPLPNLNHPHVSENEMGSNPRAMGHSTPIMTPLFQQMAEFFRHLAGTMSEPSEMNFEEMMKMGGFEFEGTIDPTVAEQWIERKERIFEQLECTNAVKFKIDKEEASKRENRFRKGNLDYGGSSKKGKFDYSKPESAQKSSYHKQNKPIFSTASTPSYVQGKTYTPTCAQYRMNHYGACRRAYGACFNCESLDHKVKDYPNPNPLSYTHIEGSVQKPDTTHSQANSGARPRNIQTVGSGGANQACGSRSTARVYAIRQKNDQDGPDVVVGKFYLFGISIVTLFDPGSSHSYVCSSLTFPDTVKSVRLDFDVLVTSLLGHQAVVNRIYRDCPFMIQKLVFLADLLEMPFQDHDVIVGMDWLHRYHALVDFRLKQVTFITPAYSHIVVQEERSLTSNIIFAVLSRKMICQGCDAYLAHIVDTLLGSPSLKDIPTMCDFPDVFPDGLPGLPPEREIEFPIELVPRTTPISITPCRMAPAELKELKA
uniref:Uncharacterized protein n=1 Tax=Nicotiana tabacum TaxID=4097 RepID=A0A1S4AIQ3_TOBAC|nr:PREDICTED: uncharacterized protein LOC107798101 [Nicotiana tabacum]